MQIEVIERLRCPAGHAESALVATASQQVERRITRGVLGCPVCGAEYPIRSGVADFRAVAGAARAPTQHLAEPNEEAAVRLAAQLDLTEPGRLVLLCGEYAPLAPPLSVMYDTMCVAIGVAAHAEGHVAAHASVLRIDAVVPLAPASLHGAAIDASYVPHCEQLRALVRPKGRLVAPASAAIPSGVSVLARDEREWVGVRTAEVVRLRRVSR